MSLTEALAIVARARVMGTLRMDTAARSEFDAARSVVHAHRMANDASYARGYHEVYSKLARAVRP